MTNTVVIHALLMSCSNQIRGGETQYRDSQAADEAGPALPSDCLQLPSIICHTEERNSGRPKIMAIAITWCRFYK